jgi:hypothetical protein
MLLPVLLGVALFSWLIALYSGFRLTAHRKPEVTLSKLISNGLAWFDASNFQEAGKPFQRILMVTLVVFFVCLFVIMSLMLKAPVPLT